ncbi:MAG TPA: hypothetical protein VKV02_08590, partial [Acidobacteriaceae bacterium]|nr:hypothetical protein [Acidobacteriaceae bacterium]
ATFKRKLTDGATLGVIISVEGYKRTGTYTGPTELYIELFKRSSLASWGNPRTTATVTQDQHSVTMAPTSAPAWNSTTALGLEHVSGTATCRTPWP